MWKLRKELNFRVARPWNRDRRVSHCENLTFGNYLKPAAGLGTAIGHGVGGWSHFDLGFKARRPLLISVIIINSLNKHYVNFIPPGPLLVPEI